MLDGEAGTICAHPMQADVFFKANDTVLVDDGVVAERHGCAEGGDCKANDDQVTEIEAAMHPPDGGDEIREVEYLQGQVGAVYAHMIFIGLLYSGHRSLLDANRSSLTRYSNVMSDTKRIGIHLSTSGGTWTAVQRAVECGANCFQIFSSSPRTWQAAPVKPEDAEKMRRLRAEHGITPLTVHASYLINLCSQTESVRENSTRAFRGEVERALAADYLVLHPGSWKGITRSEALRYAAENVERATDGLDCHASPLRILIENSAGSEFSMGATFEQIGDLLHLLDKCAPVDACLDTCHTHVAGYDLVTAEGYEETLQRIEQTMGLRRVRVWHCNDAKAAMGSRLDRHQHIGEGTLGAAAFRRLLQDGRFAHAAFIAETPVDNPSDIQRNVSALLALAALNA